MLELLFLLKTPAAAAAVTAAYWLAQEFGRRKIGSVA